MPTIDFIVLLWLGCKLPSVRLYEVVEAWKKVVHANIVQLREVFLSNDFDEEQPCKKNENELFQLEILEFQASSSFMILFLVVKHYRNVILTRTTVF